MKTETIKNKEIKGYNSFNSGIIFVPVKFIGCKADLIIYSEK